MELNQFLFPAPTPSYSSSGFIGEIIYVPKYARDAETGEVAQFVDPDYKATEKDQARPLSPQILDPDSPRKNSSLRKSMLGDAGFTKEELAIKNIRDDVTLNIARSPKENNSAPGDQLGSQQLNSYQRHVAKLDAERQKDNTTAEKAAANTGFVPCLYLPYLGGSSKLLIYFHGNAEDVGLAMELLAFIKDMLKVHVLAMEYPGYGVYEGDPDADQIALDAQNVYDYLTIVQKIPHESIILFGRSIGSGPASLLASLRTPSALLLMSPFMSIRDIVREKAGNMLQYIINDRFRNIDVMPQVQCPTFFVHGQRDQLINFQHSLQLQSRVGGPSSIIMPPQMDHNEFDFIDDLVQPFYNFLEQMNLTLDPMADDPKNGQINFPEHLFLPPKDMVEREVEMAKRTTLWGWVLSKFIVR